jgi:aminoglycoside phosphotransferase (APT) family kinase protein
MEGMSLPEERARHVLAVAGFDGAGARLLSLAENAVLALAEGPVAKVGRGPDLLDRARHELRIAHWLGAQGIPVVRPWTGRPESDGEPLLVEGHPVTLWERLPAAVRPASAADLAGLLRRVHALPDPPFELPQRDLLGGVERWLRLAHGHVDPADIAFLIARRDEYARACAELKPVFDPGPIHGDALPRNVHVGPDGPVLTDMETFSSDLREHDLVVMALTRDRYGMPDTEYEAFARGYGWDVTEWDGYLTLRGARETASAAWVAQRVPDNPAALAEFTMRVESLRKGDPAARWHSF